MVSKRPVYAEGIEFIALNDRHAVDSFDVEFASEQISVALLAALYGKTTVDVATDVVKFRQKNEKREREFQAHMDKVSAASEAREQATVAAESKDFDAEWSEAKRDTLAPYTT